ncbi:hypothetical protein [Streptomyces sp. NPDC001070]
MNFRDKDLLKSGDDHLEELFRASPAGEVPTGPMEGIGILFPGTRLGRAFAVWLRLTLWQGKLFASDGRSLINRFTLLDVPAIAALVYPGPSLMDNEPCIVIDYSQTSYIVGCIRDEIRQVGPGLYLGAIWLCGRRIGWFTLRTPGLVTAGEPAAGAAAAPETRKQPKQRQTTGV